MRSTNVTQTMLRTRGFGSFDVANSEAATGFSARESSKCPVATSAARTSTTVLRAWCLDGSLADGSSAAVWVSAYVLARRWPSPSVLATEDVLLLLLLLLLL